MLSIMKERYSLEDIIQAEVRSALASTVQPQQISNQHNEVSGGSAVASFDINGITRLLSEVNKLAASVRGGSGDSGQHGVPPVLPGGGAGKNPTGDHGDTHMVKTEACDLALEPDGVYDGILSTIGRLKTTIGDVTLSELESFMVDNRAVVVALIGQELESWKAKT